MITIENFVAAISDWGKDNYETKPPVFFVHHKTWLEFKETISYNSYNWFSWYTEPKVFGIPVHTTSEILENIVLTRLQP